MARPQQESTTALGQRELCKEVTSSEHRSTGCWKSQGQGRGHHTEAKHHEGSSLTGMELYPRQGKKRRSIGFPHYPKAEHSL